MTEIQGKSILVRVSEGSSYRESTVSSDLRTPCDSPIESELSGNALILCAFFVICFVFCFIVCLLVTVDVFFLFAFCFIFGCLNVEFSPLSRKNRKAR